MVARGTAKVAKSRGGRRPGVGPKGGRPRAESPKRQVVSLRGSEAWRDWLNGLADHCRIPATTLVDVALAKYAKDMGYGVDPPKR